MAVTDSLTLFGDASDIGQVAGTYLMANQVDLGEAGRDPGNGEVVYLNIVVTEAVTSAGAATVEFRLRSDDTATIHDTTSTGHFSSGAMAYTILTLGKTFSFPIPVEGVAYERYLGVQTLIAAATTTAGAVDAWLSPTPIGWKAKADASN